MLQRGCSVFRGFLCLNVAHLRLLLVSNVVPYKELVWRYALFSTLLLSNILNLDGKCLLSYAVEQLLGDPSFVTNAIEAAEAQKRAMFVAVCMS